MAGDRDNVTLVACQVTPIAAGNVPNTVITGARNYYGIKLSSGGVVGAPTVFDNNAGALAGTQLDSIATLAVLGFFSPLPVPGLAVLTGGITVSGGATMPGMLVYWS